MKKPILPRIIMLLLIYGVVFLLLVMIQFTRQGAFTHNVGHFVVSGYYREPSNSGEIPSSDEHFLIREVSVFFGGIEFPMGSNSGFRLRYENGATEELVPESMILSGDAVFFRLSGGSGLDFSTRYAEGTLELRISGSFGAQGLTLELPYRFLKSSQVRDFGDGNLLVTADGVDYAFANVDLDTGARILSIAEGEPAVSYRVVRERDDLIPENLVIPAALDIPEYETLLTQWRDQAFARWTQAIGGSNDEDLVNAYLGESIQRGTYRTARAAVPAAFLNGSQRTFGSSVYLGHLDTGLRSISTYEREKLSRLSRLISEKSLDFLGEFHVFEYLWIRNNGSVIDGGAEIVRALDPASLTLDMTAGVLEGWYDWRLYRFSPENPFDRLAEQACLALSAGIQKSPQGDRVFIFSDAEADTEFNLRAGKALMVYGKTTENAVWAALGRSIILSTLSLIDPAGMLSETLTLSAQGDITETAGGRQIDSVRLYRYLAPITYPHAASIEAGEGIWAWTTAQISAVREDTVLDIAVSFPAGETHYMMIRGIRPFSKIQLYGIDYRTDPQFERYDSSGWSYSASEQTLLLKLRHRSPVEHIRIFP
ncbi:MAG: hypothetical protein LBL19_02530 [Spirochaetaceae bacterium]|jgi:hypothetical protein|nr:hypothetical protein [Spirochaetaceae bacterium]